MEKSRQDAGSGVLALLALVEAAACHRVEPPPAKHDFAKADAGAPDASQVLTVMKRRGRFFMIVDSDDGPTCQPWRFERSDRPISNPAGVGYLVQDLSAGTSRQPVRFRVDQEQGRIIVGDARVIVPDTGRSGIRASLGACTYEAQWTSCDGDRQSLTPTSHDDGTIATKEGIRWYLDERVCQAALSNHRKSDPIVCPAVLSRHPAGVEILPVPEAFQRIFDAGGKLVRKSRSEKDDAPICEPWSVRAWRRGRRELTRVERKKAECLRYIFKTTLQVQLLGNAIEWAGPSCEVLRVVHTCSGGGGVGAGSIGCGDYLPVSGHGPDKILIGRESWFLDRAACERDSSLPPGP